MCDDSGGQAALCFEQRQAASRQLFSSEEIGGILQWDVGPSSRRVERNNQQGLLHSPAASRPLGITWRAAKPMRNSFSWHQPDVSRKLHQGVDGNVGDHTSFRARWAQLPRHAGKDKVRAPAVARSA